MSASPRRRASQTRNTAARYAAMQTASSPRVIEVGFSQLLHGSPGAPPSGTRPLAMLPATAPRQKGTSTEDRANAAPKFRRSRVRNTAFRNAKPAPRSTMPNAARVSGTNRVRVIEAYAVGKQVQSTTNVKINHTWLASHTGPIEWSMTSRGRWPRSASPATRSQKPAPKSAPPKIAYVVTAANKMTAAVVLIGPSALALALSLARAWVHGDRRGHPRLRTVGSRSRGTFGSSRAGPGSW